MPIAKPQAPNSDPEIKFGLNIIAEIVSVLDFQAIKKSNPTLSTELTKISVLDNKALALLTLLANELDSKELAKFTEKIASISKDASKYEIKIDQSWVAFSALITSSKFNKLTNLTTSVSEHQDQDEIDSTHAKTCLKLSPDLAREILLQARVSASKKTNQICELAINHCSSAELNLPPHDSLTYRQAHPLTLKLAPFNKPEQIKDCLLSLPDFPAQDKFEDPALGASHSLGRILAERLAQLATKEGSEKIYCPTKVRNILSELITKSLTTSLSTKSQQTASQLSNFFEEVIKLSKDSPSSNYLCTQILFSIQSCCLHTRITKTDLTIETESSKELTLNCIPLINSLIKSQLFIPTFSALLNHTTDKFLQLRILLSRGLADSILHPKSYKGLDSLNHKNLEPIISFLACFGISRELYKNSKKLVNHKISTTQTRTPATTDLSADTAPANLMLAMAALHLVGDCSFEKLIPKHLKDHLNLIAKDDIALIYCEQSKDHRLKRLQFLAHLLPPNDSTRIFFAILKRQHFSNGAGSYQHSITNSQDAFAWAEAIIAAQSSAADIFKYPERGTPGYLFKNLRPQTQRLAAGLIILAKHKKQIAPLATEAYEHARHGNLKIYDRYVADQVFHHLFDQLLSAAP